jgi:hypothetical protein
MAQITDHQKEAEKFGIKGLIVLTAYDVYNLIVSAIEGGSNYWYMIENTDEIKAATKDMKGEPLVDRMLMAINRGLMVIISDQENENKMHYIKSEDFAKAEKLMIEKHRRHLGDVLSEQDDATTGDVYFQLLVLGECIYG